MGFNIGVTAVLFQKQWQTSENKIAKEIPKMPTKARLVGWLVDFPTKYKSYPSFNRTIPVVVIIIEGWGIIALLCLLVLCGFSAQRIGVGYDVI